MTEDARSLGELTPPSADPDEVIEAFLTWTAGTGLTLYPAQEEALLEVAAGSHVIVTTPTGSGKSLIAAAAHFAALAEGRRTFYTAPIKALVAEKFFDLVAQFGPERVGMMTGDASVNPSAPIICCTAEILANIALRDGPSAPVGQAVLDEFHYFADPDRGWAWQVPLLELTDTQFVLLSATLGDVTRFAEDLPTRTGRPVAVIGGAERPVPLVHEFHVATVTEVIDDLILTDRLPAYVVHFTQAAAIDRAQALLSANLCNRAEKDAIAEAIGDFRFRAGFGRSLSRFVRNGIGVHHAGMLPRYRRLVERLAQAGLLKVICGTDTLGVGINVPIRTVVLTSLSKYDGSTTRLLTAREFHQIGGRAGRAGFDTSGTVAVLAPEHAVENARAEAKAAARSAKDGKVRRLTKKKPPPGTVSWGAATFDRLVAAPPEALTSSFRVSHGMVLNVLDRPGDGRAALRELIGTSYETDSAKQRHLQRAVEITEALRTAGVIEDLDEPDERGRTVRVTVDLQAEFALDQPLAPFALAALDLLDPASPDWPLEVVSVVESVLDDPRPVVASQRNKARAEAVAAMKAQGLDYDQRMAELETVQHPRPLADLLEPMFKVYSQAHPWVLEHELRPKSVARDMHERAMDFGTYVRHYDLARSEGTLLRYLSDVYKALVRTVPMDTKTDELWDVIEWLGEMVRQVDSSLLDEWETLLDPAAVAAPTGPSATLDERPRPVTENRRAFTVMVRNAMFRRVELAANRRWDELAEAGGEDDWDASRWQAGFDRYFTEHATIGIGADARNPAMLRITEAGRHWLVSQVLDDPAGERAWSIDAEVDLTASAETGEPVLRTIAVRDASPGHGGTAP